MKLITSSPVEGVDSGVEVTVDDERGRWLVDHGYARRAGDDADKSTVTVPDGAPAKSASKGDWVAYAVSRGVDRAEAEDSTKDELVERFG
jgi:hypothetical protein